MVEISVKVHYVLAQLMGMEANHVVRELSFSDGATVCDLMDALAEEFGERFYEVVFDPEEKQLIGNLSVIMRNTVCYPNRLCEKVLQQGDKIVIGPTYTGG